MKTLKILAVLGLTTAICVSPAFANDKGNTSKATTEFLKNAGIGGKFEVDSSKVALDKAQNPDVKAFAQQMVDDHSKANDELKSTAANEGLEDKIPAELDAKHQAALEKLEAAPAESFDKEYIKAQNDAHKEAVAAFSKYSKSGDNKALKDFATNTLPSLQEHKAKVANLKAVK